MSVNSKDVIPWSGESCWREMCQSLTTAIERVDPGKQAVGTLTVQISESYKVIDPLLHALCLKCCACCRDVCCSRATVWYDFHDILFSYYNTGNFPAHQIYRLPDGACIHLGPEGCRLGRSDRPFICSWYICPDQKASMEKNRFGPGSTLMLEIARMKEARKEMEREFMRQLSHSLNCSG